MIPRRPSRPLLALLTALALVAGACSDDPDATTATDDADAVAAAAGDGGREGEDSGGGTGPDAAEGDAPADPARAAAPGEVATAPPRPSPGCADPATEKVDLVRQDLLIEDAVRWFLLSAPASDGEPMPLVLDLHGLMEGAQIHSTMTGYGPFAQENGFVVAFPHGQGDPVRWTTEPGDDNQDLALVDAVVDHVAGQRCIDLARVYATGLSNGAMMTSFLACERSDVFAAVAPVGGIVMPEGCDPERPVPVLTTHGTADEILLFNGGVGDLGFLGGEPSGDPAPTTTTAPPTDLDGPGHPATVAQWAALNGCEDGFRDTEVSAEVIHRVYDCPPAGATEFYIVLGGGHSWPSSEFSAGISDIVGPTTFDIDATAMAWEFFRRFAL